MITVTRVQIGKAIGVALLTTLVLALAYATTAFIWWEANPGQWSPTARAVSIGFVVGLIVLRALAGRIQIAPDPADEE